MGAVIACARPRNAQRGGNQRPHEVELLTDQQIRRETAGLV
jgi:hypothetical protein